MNPKLRNMLEQQERRDAEAAQREAAAIRFVDRLTTVACIMLALAVMTLAYGFFRH